MAVNVKIADQDLVLAVLAGEKNAVSTLVERHQSFAYTLAYRVLQHKEEAEECAHDAFLKALKALDTYRMESKFTTWLYRIVVNAALSRKRKKQLQQVDIQGVVSLPGVHDPSIIQLEEQKKYINLAMSTLDDTDSLLVSLFYFKELSIEEIADITDVEKSNIKVRLFRARKKMGETLKGMLQQETKTLL
jgi:RNA polymerase sigma-70 factor (ECF subfamily)